MGWISFLAIYFILWWVVLFAMLPFGLRTQDEEDDVTLGTVSSAPRGPHMLRAFLLTTVVSGLIFGVFYAVILGFGLSFDSIPHLGPRVN
jgi:predicted secreted protein